MAGVVAQLRRFAREAREEREESVRTSSTPGHARSRIAVCCAVDRRDSPLASSDGMAFCTEGCWSVMGVEIEQATSANARSTNEGAVGRGSIMSQCVRCLICAALISSRMLSSKFFVSDSLMMLLSHVAFHRKPPRCFFACRS